MKNILWIFAMVIGANAHAGSVNNDRYACRNGNFVYDIRVNQGNTAIATIADPKLGEPAAGQGACLSLNLESQLTITCTSPTQVWTLSLDRKSGKYSEVTMSAQGEIINAAEHSSGATDDACRSVNN